MIIGLLGVAGSGKDTAGAVLAKELNGTCIAFADPMKRFCKNALGLTERQLWGDAKEKPISKKQLKALRHVPQGPRGTPGEMYFPDPTWRQRWTKALAFACGEKVEEQNPDNLHMMSHRPHYVNEFNEGIVLQWWRRIRAEKKLSPRRVLQTFGTEFGRVQLGSNFWVGVGLKAAHQVLDGWAYDRTQGLAKRHGGSNAVLITDCRFRNEVLAIKKAGGKVVRIVRPDKENGSKHASESEQQQIPDFWCDAVIVNHGTKKEFEANVSELVHELTLNVLRFP